MRAVIFCQNQEWSSHAKPYIYPSVKGTLNPESLYRLTAKIIPWNLGPLPELSLRWEIPIYLHVPVLGGWTLEKVYLCTYSTFTHVR